MSKVYLISCGEGEDKIYKIGYTKKEVEKRIKQLKTGNHQEIVIESVFETKWATKMEAVLHNKFKYCKVSGEWFKLEQKDVDNFILDCARLNSYYEDLLNNSTFKNPKTLMI
jgi:hypothetical protein